MNKHNPHTPSCLSLLLACRQTALFTYHLAWSLSLIQLLTRLNQRVSIPPKPATFSTSNNRTVKWLQSKTKLMQKGREVAPENKQLHTEKRSCKKTGFSFLRQSKEHFRYLRKRACIRKNIYMVQCGLWQSPDEISHGLAKHKLKVRR